MHAILHVLALATVAASMPIDASTTTTQNTQNSLDLDAQSVLTLIRRSTCAPDANGVMPPDCSQANSVLRAIFAISCLFIFLVLIHVWQAAKFNKIRKQICLFTDRVTAISLT